LLDFKWLTTSFLSFNTVVWGFDEQTVKVLKDMQKQQQQQQQGVGSRSTRDITDENMKKYQTLITRDVFSNKEVIIEEPTKLVTANQEVDTCV